MKKWAILAAGAALLLATVPVFAKGPGGHSEAFDQWGYNYEAKIFNGPFGYSDENKPCGDNSPDTSCGASTDSYGYYDTDGYYHEVMVDIANSRLIMKWSDAWHMAVFGPDNIRYNGDEKPWNEDAWLTNHVNGIGTLYDTEGNIIYSGKLTILSKIKWVGDTSGYTNPIWGQMAVVQKIISGEGQVFVEIPPGFGE